MLNVLMNMVLKWDLTSVEGLWAKGDDVEDVGVLSPT